MVLSEKSRIFFREFRQNFHTTGAILPSGLALAGEMTRCLAPMPRKPMRLLEVGPGTGPVTRMIARRMIPQDRLEAVEINPVFASTLKLVIANEPEFAAARGQIEVLEQNILEFSREPRFDAIFCGLPFNNFEPQEVGAFFDCMLAMLKPGGELSYFEYWAIRSMKLPFAGKKGRERLKGIGQLTGEIRKRFGSRSHLILANIPPALVHHLVKPT